MPLPTRFNISTIQAIQGPQGPAGKNGTFLGSTTVGGLSLGDQAYATVLCPAGATTTIWTLGNEFPSAPNLAVGEQFKAVVAVSVDASNAQGQACFVRGIKVKNDPNSGVINPTGGTTDVDLTWPTPPSNVAATFSGISCAFVVSGTTVALQMTMPSGVSGIAFIDDISFSRFQGNANTYAPVYPPAGIVADWDADNAPNASGVWSGNLLDSVSGLILAPVASPTWAAGQINGHAAITTNGITQVGKNTTLTQGQPNEIWVVMKQIGWTAGAYIVGSNAGTTNIDQRASSPGISMFASFVVNENDTLPLGTWGIIRTVWDHGGASSLTIGTNTVSSGDPGPNTIASGIQIGGDTDVSSFSNMAWTRFIVVDPTQPGYNATLLYNYLAFRY